MFTFQRITEKDKLDAIYRLRYKVYCDEWGFERPEDHPEGTEIDQYDQYSTHFAAVREDNGQFIGTVRLIFDSPLGFPLEQHCEVTADLTGIDRSRLGEISRLAVSKDYRKRLVDRIMFDGENFTDELHAETAAERRRTDFEIVLGLYCCIYMESLQQGLTHLYAAMANSLFLLLKRNALVFDQIGPTVDYHGKRSPYMCEIHTIIDNFARKNPELFSSFMAKAA